MDHERDHYAAACQVDFSDVTNPSLLALRPKLGTSIAVFTVKVARIAITSETTRDAVFWETKIYDVAHTCRIQPTLPPGHTALKSGPGAIELVDIVLPLPAAGGGRE